MRDLLITVAATFSFFILLPLGIAALVGSIAGAF